MRCRTHGSGGMSLDSLCAAARLPSPTTTREVHTGTLMMRSSFFHSVILSFHTNPLISSVPHSKYLVAMLITLEVCLLRCLRACTGLARKQFREPRCCLVKRIF